MAFVSAIPLKLERSRGIRVEGVRNSKTISTCKLSTRAKTIKLRELLAEDRLLLMPCCYDALSARLIERADFEITFMSGFGTAGVRGLPDTGLLGYKDMVDNVASIAPIIDIPLLADGDTGFGNAINVRRTVMGYYHAGASGLFIEDQVNPKR